MLPQINPTGTASWQKLRQHADEVAGQHLRDWFLNEPNRFAQFSLRFKDCLFDFSKNRISRRSMALLKELAEECGLKEAIEQQRSGVAINETEQRAVMHAALRNFSDREIRVNGEDVMPGIRRVLQQMKTFSEQLISGQWRGFQGDHITDVVNIGIGGSDLGPVMAYEALKPYHVKQLHCHFVSNVDGAHFSETVKDLDPARTLFIIASKTFTTQETMANAHSARQWFLQSGANESDIARHFVAVSTNAEAVDSFGIDTANMFEFWDWVGGRYSLWSAIGLALCCGLGYEHYEQMLRGAHAMDQHFHAEPLEQNIPVLMALIGIWNVNFLGAESEAIIPYSQNMHRFAAYFQQANMESNGKSYDRKGQRVDYHTGPVVWGEPGTNGQHAFFQLLHQGTRLIPVDFIGFAQSHYDQEHHQKLMANFFAQSEALMKGRTLAEVKHLQPDADERYLNHKVFEGNHPSSSFVAPLLSPYYLGLLTAAYEHKIFCQGIIWNIFSFDQWGVELGKVLAKRILPKLEGEGNIREHDHSTAGLIKYYLKTRKQALDDFESKGKALN